MNYFKQRERILQAKAYKELDRIYNDVVESNLSAMEKRDLKTMVANKFDMCMREEQTQH